MKKYEFTGETIEHDGRTLHQIIAVRDFGGVEAGDVGGWLEGERNLSHDGLAWVGGNARVSGKAHITDNAWVYGRAWVCGRARVYGRARVGGGVRE